MTSRMNADWKKIRQFRNEQQKKVAAQEVPAPSLISANVKLLRLAREINADQDNDAVTLVHKEVFKTS
ncbi:hypothetical protein IFU23_24260 [Pantoea agglomerans]|uniref:Uncharacterized protein n=1 Tax=Enterobacter agglomerans TaxID=549 RepID=A0ACC5PWI9_ENTAG|nr:hypothetical protein [Pantoea agglomerans]MBD8129224.1 hypothetical protein [Pantoea agglomerans]MBD8156437.1 hypothetical protein [Pantoea agglomerans]MBD8161197.1 hypothetical protein [Pantoea agglomerans]MBD8234831.1 hypothetical protein [Pantoea agglomerans]MBD8245250.1 hypothetical protein [Pantoea agglomerans]